ncbi:MAG: hypothetical protein Q9225_001359 [Loekoesia sp. 1 TL-2023]
MEKIKNLVNPGKSKDDEIMYGSGQSGDPVHSGTQSQATSSDPVASSTHPTGGSTREPIGQGGTGSVQQGSNPLSSSRMPGTFEDEVGSTSSIKSGLPGNTQESKMTGVPETRDPLDTNKALPREPVTASTRGVGTSSAGGAGPHSSTLANKADPRVDSDLDGSRRLGGQGTTGTAGGVTGSNFPERTGGNTSGSGRSFPLGGASSGTTTSGPHTSDLANKADPRVDGDRDGSRGLGGTSGYGSGTSATVGSAHQGDLSRSGAGPTTEPATSQTNPRGYGEESWTHDHGQRGHEYIGDPCENEPPAPGAPHFTSGPHSLDTANRLDPHVGGASIGGTPSSTTGSSTTHAGHHHPGRDVALGAGAGATSTGVYEASRDVPSSTTTQHDRSAAGPHKSDLMNKMDPRVDSDLSKQQGSTAAPGTTGLGSTSVTESPAGREHHSSRNAALAGAGGVAGAAVYEGEKHRGHNIPEGTSSSGYSNPYPPNSAGTGVGAGPTSTTGSAPSATGATNTSGLTATSKDHHYGRDAGLAGVGAGAAYEADKHLGGSHGDTAGTRTVDPTLSQQPASGTSGPGYGRDAGMTGTGTTGIHESRYQPGSTSGPAGQPTTAYDDRTRAGESHAGRDAALRVGAGAAAVAGGEELSRKELERQQKAAHKEEMKEQEAAHKQELKEQKHRQHEQEKAEKAHEKAIAKEEKHHQHEKEKAEKAHEKALAKEEAKHQHKEEPQEGEKKHHGLFGFLHRDKPDKELKEDEIARKEQLEQETHPDASTTAGAGAATADTAGLSEMEKHQRAKEHDRNRLHKDPPPGFGQTEYAEAPKEGYASQVTGGTGTTALAQGDSVSRGSHITGLGNKADPKVMVLAGPTLLQFTAFTQSKAVLKVRQRAPLARPEEQLAKDRALAISRITQDD